MDNSVKRIERGWGGHFIGATSCLFRRNTLLDNGLQKIVISTVGNYELRRDDEYTTYHVDAGRKAFYETKVFVSKNDKYDDAYIQREFKIDSDSYLTELDDIKANEMHENVVNEFIEKMKKSFLKWDK